MSIKVMDSIWEHSAQKGPALLLLLAIADIANEYGEAFPGVARLAKKCRMKDRNVQGLLRRLQEDGELEVEIGAGMMTKHGPTNLFRIITPGALKRDGVQKLAPVQSSVGTGASLRTDGVQKLAPKPLDKPSVNRKRETPPVTDPGAYRQSEPDTESAQTLHTDNRHDRQSQDLLFEAICTACGYDWTKATFTAKKRGMVVTNRQILAKVQATPEQVAAFWSWFAQYDFRGRKGERPTPALIVDLWDQFLAFVPGREQQYEKPGQHHSRDRAVGGNTSSGSSAAGSRVVSGGTSRSANGEIPPWLA